jgi:hypothetical protein
MLHFFKTHAMIKSTTTDYVIINIEDGHNITVIVGGECKEAKDWSSAVTLRNFLSKDISRRKPVLHLNDTAEVKELETPQSKECLNSGTVGPNGSPQ